MDQGDSSEGIMKRIEAHKGVIGYILTNAERLPIKTTLDNTVTLQYVSTITGLVEKARSLVRDIDPGNDLTFLRLRCKKHEIMVAPDKEFMIMVFQHPE